jgi:transcriptional regulator with XRE-family HTH domain
MARDICLALGERIRQLRLKRGWRQIDLAEHAGMHENYVSDLELGHKEICLRMLGMVARALDTTPSELLKGIERSQEPRADPRTLQVVTTLRANARPMPGGASWSFDSTKDV